MSRLRISLTKIPEDGLEFGEHIVLRDIQPPDAEELPVDSVTLEGTLVPISGDYLFQGRIAGTFVHPCDRCLLPARVDFDLSVVWTFQEGAEAAATGEELDEETEFAFEGSEALQDFQPFNGDEIDLAPSVWEEVALATPVKYVCRNDCAGLCPACGANWNETECACERAKAEPELPNNAFAGLRDLFPDLPK